jgi:hypothetical protein
METVYLVCAVLGGTFVVCQFLVTLLGLGGHHDMAGHDGGGHGMGGHDVSGHDASGHDASGHGTSQHHQASHEAQPNWFVSLLTFRALTAAFAFFGLMGLASIRLEMEPVPGLASAVGAGVAALVSIGWLMRLLFQLNIDGTVRIERAVGAAGSVYLSVPGGRSGVGKVHVSQFNRTVEYKAITAGEELATGAKIVVVAIVGADTVLVAPAPSLERTAHA